MEQVISAVGYAHRQGVVHRDLKPSNVMVMANGEAKVTDFGIAKVLGSSKLTRTGTAMGSAHYMSPEQIRRPETVDARSDIYSLGCVFYEVLTGQPPFGEKDASGTESDFEIKEGHVRGNIPALSSLRPDIPGWLAQVVMAMLEKDPDQRPSSCEMTLERLKAEGILEGVQSGTKKEDAPAGKIDHEQKVKGSSQDNAAGSVEKQVDKPFKKGALAIIVLIVVAFVIFIQSNKTPDQELSTTVEAPVPTAEKIVVAIAKQAEQLKSKIEAGNPNGLVHCAPDENLRFDNCWGSRRESGDGGSYIGEFKDGKKHGLGTYTWTDGEQYVGEWSYEKRSGKGTQTKANGEKYVGEYYNGFFHGKGIKYASNGSVIESGIYKNGHLVKSQ
jgi:hypothetical protein